MSQILFFLFFNFSPYLFLDQGKTKEKNPKKKVGKRPEKFAQHGRSGHEPAASLRSLMATVTETCLSEKSSYWTVRHLVA